MRPHALASSSCLRRAPRTAPWLGRLNPPQALTSRIAGRPCARSGVEGQRSAPCPAQRSALVADLQAAPYPRGSPYWGLGRVGILGSWAEGGPRVVAWAGGHDEIMHGLSLCWGLYAVYMCPMLDSRPAAYILYISTVVVVFAVVAYLPLICAAETARGGIAGRGGGRR